MLLGRGVTILRGCGVLPPRDVLQRMAKASYAERPPAMISSYRLVHQTPTLKFYLLGNTIVVAIRGTKPTEKDDLVADANIALGRLPETARFKRDQSTLLSIQNRYPPSKYDYYGVGHSLGGAILDEFIHDGWIKNGISYNPAIAPRDVLQPNTNQRIYAEGDPLYKVMGQFAKGSELRPKKETTEPPSLVKSIVSNIPVVGTLFNAYEDHKLDNFEGGATHRKNVLKKLGLEDNGYSIAELAKASGVPKKILQQVYNRGIGAYKTNPQSVRMKGSFKKGVDAPMSQKLSKEQWAMSRIYSFLDGNPKHDSDLRGGKTERFHRELEQIGLSPTAYLRSARQKAKKEGYDPQHLSFANNGVHKLAMKDETSGTTYFGRVGYKDHLMWSQLEKSGSVAKGVAAAKRDRFVKSHSAMKGDWKSNPFSANNLALRILW